MPPLFTRPALLCSFALAATALSAAEPRDPARLSAEFCVGCHGPNLAGGTGPSLVDTVWKNGDSDASILRGIRDGYPLAGMIGYGALLTEPEQTAMLAYIRRLGRQSGFGQIQPPTPPAKSVEVKSLLHNFRVETFAAPLEIPWGIAFVPDGGMFVSDRVGTIRAIAKDGTLSPDPIRDAPKPFVRQDGGMLDLIAHPDYAKNGWLYLAYTELGQEPRKSMTVIVRGKVRDGAWVDQQVIFRADPKYYFTDTSHYGCRFHWDATGHLFFTIGERGKSTDAQDITSPLGKIHRINDDGTIPRDNPFVGRAGACESIWSYGNRHVQGLKHHPVTGKLWATEHGPTGGDELNRIEPGHNYGWPTASHGVSAFGEKILGVTAPDTDAPIVTWTPTIAPTAIEFYAADRFPKWKNSLFVACLFGRQLRRIETDGDRVVSQEAVFTDMGRVRDVVTGPDGLIYVALNNPGRIARLVPVE